MARWQHLGCGAIYQGKTPPFICGCNDATHVAGWRRLAGGPGLSPSPGVASKRKSFQSSSKRARQIRSLIRRDKECQVCGETDPAELTRDHIVPLSRGGTNRLENLMLLCQFCNGRKGDQILTVEQMRATWGDARREHLEARV